MSFYQIHFCFSLAIFVFTNTWVKAQESERLSFKKYHRITAATSHSHLRSGIVSGDQKWLALPSLGFDYDFWWNPKWGAGLHSDIVIENFEVETDLSSDDVVIKRSKPLASAAMLCYKPWRHLTFLGGLGGEFAKEENLFLVRLGAEYGAEIDEDWEVSLNLMYDIKWHTYDTWVIGLGISRIIKCGKSSE